MVVEKIISDRERKEIEDMFPHVPYKKAVCIDALRIVQKYHGWVSDEAVKELSEIIEMSPDEIDSVATFYNNVFRKPVGRHVIMICDSISCWVMGYEQILEALKNKLSIKYGETTADNRFTLLPIVCLGNCDHAPTMIIDRDLHNDVTIDKLDDILERYQ
ncbi:MAG TPA: NADH-quinone oxidoreductase subunit NuoE [Hanamia sp.]|nr:NADH-quinone oxidoreductase subunit NuoE [Hanamia sp.]